MVAFPVGVCVIADFSSWFDEDILINDGPPDPTTPADFHPIHDDRFLNLTMTVDADISTDN